MRKWMIIEIQNISLSLREREGLAGPSWAKAQREYATNGGRSWYLPLLIQCCWTHSFWDFLAKIYNLNFNIRKHQSGPKLETELLDNSLHSSSRQGHGKFRGLSSLEMSESRCRCTLVITFCFSWLLHAYVRCSHLGKLGKWHTGNLCTIFATFLYVWNYFKIKWF